MSNFQTDCQNSIDRIPEEVLSAFNSAKDAESRVKIIYEYINISVELDTNRKNLSIAEAEKANGNKYFAKKDYKNAVKAYNTGIMSCPQNTDSAKEMLAILVANRSATFFEMQEYRKVLNDIDYIMEIDKYPKHLQYKVFLRKAKSYDALQNERLANEVYSQAFEYMKSSKLEENFIAEKMKEINLYRDKMKEKPIVSETAVLFSGEERFISSEVYVASSNKISFEQDMTQGRYAIAKEDIPTGQIIIQENSHCAVVSPENSFSNCQHCLISTNQIFACPGCSIVVFCSSNCERKANRTYHKYECVFQKTLFQSGASINCALALRIITQRDVKFFMGKRKQLQDFLRDNCKKTFKKINPYRSEDYSTVFTLCRNEFSRSKEELLHFSCMALYLLKLLKTSGYFLKREAQDNKLTEEENFISALILRHLELLQFNCHEVAELRNSKSGIGQDDNETCYVLEHIGGALYPTASLFNHSCDPSIVRYNIGNTLVVRTIKPIREGDIIYENYGPMYTTMKREYRQQFLRKRYWFDCMCVPCIEHWPLLDKMNENEMKITCSNKNCEFVSVINKIDTNPFLICEYCGNRTNLFPILKNLMDLQTILPNAEHFYGNGHYPEAIKLYINALKILHRFLKPPCPDMVKIQQRLRTCFIHYGNKSLEYIPRHLY
ncbi:hypothetical protein HHI36_023623 [Cryptolaemus montrouzieri]|uniref:Protein-lysine N-methyltransferase SMYD4 n=1 Tax=Cryptolaemus montrouzieri TaxID=559131 RepID=A0ABD2PHU0_9CUCU